jgi:hypothetical protein
MSPLAGNTGRIVSTVRRVVPVGIAVGLWLLVSVSSAAAATPWWNVNSSIFPSHLAPGGSGTIFLYVTNLGDGTAAGESEAIKIGDELPPGVTATGITGETNREMSLNCTPSPLSCTYQGPIEPYKSLIIKIAVSVAGGTPSGEPNKVTVSGGQAASIEASTPLVVSDTGAGFGVEKVELLPSNQVGAIETQAGAHPFELTTTFDLNSEQEKGGSAEAAPDLVKDINFYLPPGLVGNAQATPQCTEKEYATVLEPPVATPGANACPANTVVGVASLILGRGYLPTPLFNLVPEAGEPARFGFIAGGVPVYLDTSVRTGGDYGVVVSVRNIFQGVPLDGAQTTFWGVPADPRHDASRGWNCLLASRNVEPCVSEGEQTETPFLTLPTSCQGPLAMTVQADSWQEPETSRYGQSLLRAPDGSELGLTGCNRLRLEPSLAIAPDVSAGSTPTGLTVNIHIPQVASMNPTGLAESAVRDATVRLPEGVALNPAAADGLLACSVGQVGLEDPGFSSCPQDSKIGTVEIKTPDLPNPLTGAAYLATQEANPFGSLVAIYLVMEDPVSGVRVKLAGEVSLDQHTGQIVSTFKDDPQLPFEDLTLHFFGGARAPLATPIACGGYTTTTSIAPWSGNPAVEPSSEFKITSGPNGAPCSGTVPFAPSLTAGATNIQSGAFTPFTMTMSREDGQQGLDAIRLRMPPGLLGTLASVKLCGEAEADAGTCGPASEIGKTIVSVGLGGDPFSVTGGKVFITGPYEGAPYGLSIVNPAKAGPFDLEKGTPCDCVVVRAKLEVDPITAALTVSTDSTGPYAIPQIIKGVPLQIKHVNVTIDRPGFTFNPTDCNPLAITGAIASSEGATSNVSVPFQVTNCAALAFKPGFSVSTAGKTSRKNGASLHVKLVYPKSPFGSQANIKSVKVDLPKQLPSRLTTLQQACPVATFEANPAACPAHARVGTTRARTPLLPVDLTGPAYFVSHGGAKFPELVIVLSGYGVTVDLHAETFISKAGITSSTFHTIPDVPVGSFELTLPEGAYSALAANGDLCKTKLKMPTAFTAQNGAVIHQATPIAVTGCGKAKSAKGSLHKRERSALADGAGHTGRRAGRRGAGGRGRA